MKSNNDINDYISSVLFLSLVKIKDLVNNDQKEEAMKILDEVIEQINNYATFKDKGSK